MLAILPAVFSAGELTQRSMDPTSSAPVGGMMAGWLAGC